MTIELTDQTFTQTINQTTPTLVQFTASWCGPCKAMAPIIQQLQEDNLDITVAKLDIDDYPEIAQLYKIKGVPTFILFQEGQFKSTKVGGCSKKDLQEYIDRSK